MAPVVAAGWRLKAAERSPQPPLSNGLPGGWDLSVSGCYRNVLHGPLFRNARPKCFKPLESL
jgi:hypothetical protein